MNNITRQIYIYTFFSIVFQICSAHYRDHVALIIILSQILSYIFGDIVQNKIPDGTPKAALFCMVIVPFYNIIAFCAITISKFWFGLYEFPINALVLINIIALGFEYRISFKNMIKNI